MVRAQLRFNGANDAAKFVQILNSDGSTDKYVLQNDTGDSRVEARSLMGVLYMMAEFNENCYLINETHDGKFPFEIDTFRF